MMNYKKIKIPKKSKSKNFDVFMISRKTDINRSHEINLKEIILSSNVFNFLLNIFSLSGTMEM